MYILLLFNPQVHIYAVFIMKHKKFRCTECGYLCLSISGLTRHTHHAHPITFDLSPQTDQNTTDISDSPQFISDIQQSIHNDNSNSNDNEYQTGEMDPERDSEDDSDSDSKGDSEDDSESEDNITLVASDSLDTPDTAHENGEFHSDVRGGHRYGSKGQQSPSLYTQQAHHAKHGNPYYPWKNEKELWISNLIYAEARMSITVADKFLKGISDGNMKIEGMNINSAKSMYSVLDQADYVPVCI
jgi:hypothetical protein